METSILTFATPGWSVAISFALIWMALNKLERAVQLWALLTLPATALHEFAHCMVGLVLGARPSSFNLWPKRVSRSSWRLGYVGFTRLRWWNGGAIALAPLLWLLLIAALARHAPSLPNTLTLQTNLGLAVTLVWLVIAVAPSRTDWKLALQHWPSATMFLVAWFAIIYWLLEPYYTRFIA
jgi:hypothetical protein